MKRKILITLFFIFLSVLVNLLLPRVARGAPRDCVLRVNGKTDLRIEVTDEITFDFDFTPVVNDFANTNFLFSFPGTIVGRPQATIMGRHAIYITGHHDLIKIGTHRVELLHESLAHACNEETYEVYHRECEITIVPANPDFNSDITIQVREMIRLTTKTLEISGPLSKKVQIGSVTENYDWHVGQLSTKGWYNIRVYDASNVGSTAGLTICEKDFYVSKEGEEPPPEPIPTGKPVADPCWDPEKKEAVPACVACLGGSSGYDENRPDLAAKSWTALGCIPNDPRDFVAWLLARAIGIGGGIAFLLMIWGGFQVITAAGDPDRLNAGKEIITSAIAGLLLIIFSLFLLQLIGVDILGLKEVGFKFGGG